MTDATVGIPVPGAPDRPSWRRWTGSSRLRHACSAMVGATFWCLFAYANITGSIESHRVIGAGLGVLGLWAAILFLVRRPAVQVSRSIPVWVVAYVGTFGASALRPGGADAGWNDGLGLSLQAAGVLLGACGYLALGRSFGLVPANRGLVTSGAYGIVRHPLYASYLVAELGYLVQSPTVWNVVVLAVVWSCQAVRLLGEERLLSNDPAYRAYCLRTPRRVVPGIW